jgi:hypothetical protein
LLKGERGRERERERERERVDKRSNFQHITPPAMSMELEE